MPHGKRRKGHKGMIWLYFVLMGLGVGFILGDRSKGIIWNLLTGVIGAVLGGAAFEYILRDHYSPFVNMYRWGVYADLFAAFFSASLLTLLKRLLGI
jgi:uncharacterized membrane protein YeaQ/YmgE (transglycosylase-associated protein family)